MDVDPLPVALRAATVLDRLGVPYVLGGSLASTLYGEPRSSVDVDFALQLDAEGAATLCRALEPYFHVQAETVRAAAEQCGHFNAIDRESFVKVDMYVRPPTGLYASEIERARRVELGDSGPGVRVASPEDTVLQKLRWYEQAGRTSERQWRDVVGILKVQRAALERAYLSRWADELELAELLRRALEEAGLAPD